MKFTELKKSLVKLNNVYYAFGEDYFLVQKAVSMIEAAANVQMPELNKTVLSADNFTATAFVSSANKIPFAADKTVLLINLFNFKKAQLTELAASLKKYAASVCGSTVVIIYAQEKFSEIEKAEGVTVVACEKLENALLLSLIAKEIESYGKKIDKDAADLLILFCDAMYTNIDTEIKKVCALCKDEDVITKQHIEQIANKTVAFAVFELTNAITKKDFEQAMLIFQTLLKEKVDLHIILATIIKNFKRQYFAKFASESNKEVGTWLKVSEFAIKYNRADVQKLSDSDVEQNYLNALQAEWLIKSGKVGVQNVIESIIFNRTLK